MLVFLYRTEQNTEPNITTQTLTSAQKTMFVEGNSTYIGMGQTFEDAANKLGKNKNLIFNFTKDNTSEWMYNLLEGKSIEVNLGKPFTTEDAAKAYSATLLYAQQTLEAVKKNLKKSYNVDTEVEAITKTYKGKNNSSVNQVIGYKLVPLQTPEEMANAILDVMEPGRIKTVSTSSSASRQSGTNKIMGGMLPGGELLYPMGSGQSIIAQLWADEDNLRRDFNTLENTSLDNFTGITDGVMGIVSLDQNILVRLRERFPGDQKSQDEAYAEIWKRVMSGAPESSLAKVAFANGYTQNSALYYYNRMRAVTLMNEVDKQLYKLLTQNYSKGETEFSVRENIGILLHNIENTGMSEYAARQMFGKNGEALDACIKHMGLEHLTISTNGKELTVGEKYKLLIEFLKNNIGMERGVWGSFAATHPQTAATLTIAPVGLSISDDAWSKMGSPLVTKPDTRQAYDIFTALSFAHSSRSGAFAKVTDDLLVNLTGMIQNDPIMGLSFSPGPLARLPPHASILFAANPEIIDGVLRDGANLDRALGRLKIGIDVMTTIYNGSDTDFRFQDMAEFIGIWAKLEMQGNVMTEAKRKIVRGTEYGQIEIASPVEEMFQTFGQASSTFNANNILARYHVGNMMFMDQPVYGLNGRNASYDDMRGTRDFNFYQRDLSTFTLPYTYINTAYWEPPPLYLRLDESAYVNQIYTILREIQRKRADYSSGLSSIGGAVQGSFRPDEGEFDTGIHAEGKRWGQYGALGGSTKGENIMDKDDKKIADTHAQQFRLDAQNLQTQTAGVNRAFATWLADQSNKFVVIGGKKADLNKVGETLTLGTGNDLSSNMTITNTGTSAPTLNSGAYIGNADIIVGGYHQFNKTQTESGGGINTKASKQDDFGAYFMLNGFWYRLDFHGRMHEDVTNYLNANAPVVNADDALTHTYQEVGTPLAGTVGFNAGVETHAEHDNVNKTSIPNNGALVGYFAAIKLPSNTAAIAAKTIENDWGAGIAQLFGGVDDGTLVMVSARELPVGNMSMGTLGTYGSNVSTPGRGVRAYTIGEEAMRQQTGEPKIKFYDVVFQGINRYKIEGFSGATQNGEQGMTGAMATNKNFGVGAFYSYQTITDANGKKQTVPAEAFFGAGAKGKFFKWPTTATGFYYENDVMGVKQFGWSTATKLSDNVTLYSNALFNPKTFVSLFTPKALSSIQDQVGVLSKTVSDNAGVFQTDYNQRVALSKQYGQALMSLHNSVTNYLPTDEFGSSFAQFSLGVLATNGVFAQMTWAQSPEGAVWSSIFMPSRNLSFFISGAVEKQMLGGMKYADGNVSVTGMYMKADTKDIYAAQVALRDSIGVSIMTSPDHDYYRGTFVLGGRTSPSHVSILLDYTKLGDFSGFGAMGTYYTAAGFDIAAGFSRQIELGINSTTMNLSTYYTTPKQNVMMGAKIGATQVGQFIWGTVRFELNVRF